MYKYAVAEELVGQDVWQRLQSLEPLRAGQTTAKEREPVKPVPIQCVRATAVYLFPVLKAMLRIHIATGIRPSELCRIGQVLPSILQTAFPEMWYCSAGIWDLGRAIVTPNAKCTSKPVQFWRIQVQFWGPLVSCHGTLKRCVRPCFYWFFASVHPNGFEPLTFGSVENPGTSFKTIVFPAIFVILRRIRSLSSVAHNC